MRSHTGNKFPEKFRKISGKKILIENKAPEMYNNRVVL